MTDQQPQPGPRQQGVFGARREAMRGDLVAAMGRLHTRRRWRRRIGTSVGVLMLGAGAWLLAGQRPPDTSPGRPGPAGIAQRSDVLIVRVVGSGRTGLIRSINDDELVERLAEINRPTGLVRTTDSVWLTEAVVDNGRAASGRQRTSDS